MKQAEEATEVRVPMTLADAGYLACKHVAEFDCRDQQVVMPAYFLANPICEIISYPCAYRTTLVGIVYPYLSSGVSLSNRATSGLLDGHLDRQGVSLSVQGDHSLLDKRRQ